MKFREGRYKEETKAKSEAVRRRNISRKVEVRKGRIKNAERRENREESERERM